MYCGASSQPKREKPLENRVSQGLACGSINPTRTRIDAGNAGETACFDEGGAESGARDIQSGAPWEQIRSLISDCPDPSEEARQSLVAQGDVATCTCNGEPLEFPKTLPATGPIGLEADRGQVEYRRIRIRETEK